MRACCRTGRRTTRCSGRRRPRRCCRGRITGIFSRRCTAMRRSPGTTNLQGVERLRVIVNAFTRLRYCSADGEMEFHHKGAPGTQPAGWLPWFEVPGRKSADATIIIGHWSTLGLINRRPDRAGYRLPVGRPLTAVRLEDRQVFAVPVSAAARDAQKPSGRRFRLRREFAPVAVRQDGFAELQFGDEAGFADDLLEALPQAHLVDVGGRGAVFAVQRAVAQRRRHDRAVQFDRRLQQRRHEAPQPAPVAGGAFGNTATQAPSCIRSRISALMRAVSARRPRSRTGCRSCAPASPPPATLRTSALETKCTRWAA
jgi:hypothetical protein